jgi:hypothetical protein
MNETQARSWIDALNSLARAMDRGDPIPEHVKTALATVNGAAARQSMKAATPRPTRPA